MLRIFASLVVLCSLVAGSSCQGIDKMLEGMDKPTASVAGVRFQGIDAESVTLAFDLDVRNPYSVPLPVAGIDWSLASAGQQFISGQSDGNASIPASGSKIVPLVARIPFQQTLSILSGVSPGAVVPYQADLGIRVDAPGLDQLRLPISKSGEFPIPTVPKVSVQNIRWDSFSFTNAAATLLLGIENTNQFPVDLTRLGYDLALGGQRVARSAIADGTSFSSGEMEMVEIGFSLEPASLGLAAFNLLRGDEANYNLSGLMDLGTQFGNITLPYDSAGKTDMSR